MRLANLFKQSSIYLVGDVARRSIGFLMIPVYTHYLSSTEYGIIELIELFVMIAGIFFGLAALSDGMVRVYYDLTEEERHRVVSTTIIATACAGIVIAGIVVLVATPLSALTFNTREYASLIRASFLAMLFTAVIDVSLTYQRIRQRAVFFVSYSVTQLLANVALNVYFIVFAHKGVWGFVLAKLVCSACGAIYLMTVVFREIPWGFWREDAGRIAEFAVPLIPSGGAFFIIHFSDRFFLNHYAALSDIGVYALAYKFGFLVTYLVGQPFGSVWGVSLYKQVGQDNWQHSFARVASYLVFFLMLTTVAIGVFMDKGLTLAASASYAAAASLIPVLAFGYAFREVGDFFRGMLFINKRVKLFGKVTIACASLNLLLNYLLIGKYKASGAAWATLLTWLAYMVACWILAHREHPIPYPVRSFVVLTSLAAAACASHWYLGVLPIAWQWIASGAVLLAFVGLTWALGYFDSQERRTIRQQLAEVTGILR